MALLVEALCVKSSSRSRSHFFQTSHTHAASCDSKTRHAIDGVSLHPTHKMRRGRHEKVEAVRDNRVLLHHGLTRADGTARRECHTQANPFQKRWLPLCLFSSIYIYIYYGSQAACSRGWSCGDGTEPTEWVKGVWGKELRGRAGFCWFGPFWSKKLIF